ncbi:MAG: phosphoglycerate kinase [Candidatus Yanofskybacteria bacterium RIFCSPHIGHO2_02_FULL_38_22b]|uniref:Phosphoglycerate kinase n=1 Tax=Candidatus Yanofskybacteria bacterium RIFCSPHIGHO2_02_FULL_38_22b TaxID=1802673 RepID=A0A1F8EZ84_9BACT|nr:MAG: phosphoglycerate kinase [Candidatus Yanofskybacteria bacterium RIFCSPHIGHO2_01_FULL_39_44]OGN06187.1 MAG: phosphoglycerate kinase [Candidatus Yanofskybacteria bacterium RIFCSPHIGHO2_02_FULL_38_22b]OGN19607.1 MAG: phosphoglycerate kinase [Candidatus Yanofskybacteria bacterium RIFCSPLOWO2_01_FULL_39_28]
MKTILDIPDLKDKKILLRVDFDVPVDKQGIIIDSFRVKQQKETIDLLVSRGAKVFMVAHSNYIISFELIVEQLQDLLGYTIKFIHDIQTVSKRQINEGLALLENIRVHEGEKKNDTNLGQLLSAGFDYYINNAFAECHRNYVSVSAVTKFLPSYAGLLIEKETQQLQKVIDAPPEGKIIIIGGAKASTKIPVIKNLINKAEAVIVGGVIANDILKSKGEDVGNAIVDNNLEELFSGLDLNDPRIIMPDDFNLFENRMPDIGPLSVKKFSEIINQASMIVWNGPVGIFEDERFTAGTKGIAEAVAGSRSFKVLGGGDTISAVEKFGLLDRFDFVSTGGGAMLAFLAGDKLPGLEALGYYK